MARLVIVTTADLAPGFRLAGTRTRAVETAAEADAALRALSADGETGVIGVHEPFLAALDPERRHALEDQVTPVVIAVPPGAQAGAAGDRRARLAELLRRAVGFQTTFRGGEEG